MTILSNRFSILAAAASLIFFVGCGSQGAGYGDGTGSGSGVDFSTSCGVVSGSKVKNPVSLDDGEPVQVLNIAAPNAVIVQGYQPDSGQILVKLQGVSSTRIAKRNAAMNRLASLSGGTVYFYQAKKDCIATVDGGGQAAVGQLINGRGQSFAEEVIKGDLVDVTVNDVCGGEMIGGCLAGLVGTNTEVAGPLDQFLWKPTSDNNSNLAVHTGPYGTDVYVNGEHGQNAGPGNGYGSLARFSKGGCSYPSPRIQVYDGASGLPYTVGGQTTFSVPNPCGRNCLTDGTIQACSKN
jgi:hypothetical protein